MYRLITVDRPGYGRSDPLPGMTLASWTGDLLALIEHLQLGPCPVIGWSGGGPYAIAAAICAPEKVTRIGLAASDAPLREVPGVWDTLTLERQRLRMLLKKNRGAAIAELRTRLQPYAENPTAIFGGAASDPPDADDRMIAADPQLSKAISLWFTEGARQGVTGYLDDNLTLIDEPWSFRLSDIGVPTIVWWGGDDRLTPRSYAEYLAGAIPRAKLVIFPGEGHLAPVSRWRDMLIQIL